MALTAQKKQQIAEHVRQRFSGAAKADSPVPPAVLLALMAEQQSFVTAVTSALDQLNVSLGEAVAAFRTGVIGGPVPNKVD